MHICKIKCMIIFFVLNLWMHWPRTLLSLLLLKIPMAMGLGLLSIPGRQGKRHKRIERGLQSNMFTVIEDTWKIVSTTDLYQLNIFKHDSHVLCACILFGLGLFAWFGRRLLLLTTSWCWCQRWQFRTMMLMMHILRMWRTHGFNAENSSWKHAPGQNTWSVWSI